MKSVCRGLRWLPALLVMAVSSFGLAQERASYDPVKDAAGNRLWWAGPQYPGGRDGTPWPLVFEAARGAQVREIRAEIVLRSGEWRFGNAVEGSGLRVSSRTVRLADSSGALLILTISSREGEFIPSGRVATVMLRDVHPSRSWPEIRRLTTGQRLSAQDAIVPLEPPQADPPINPVPVCFFFTH